ncbi:hypothetical protein [Nonomuraea sp. NPDC049607]|uniref:hypothetical protein n=1 Tax=Nonomuraea sp. NPDC049607 TaxID=3154732 RepID=UPI00343C5167
MRGSTLGIGGWCGTSTVPSGAGVASVSAGQARPEGGALVVVAHRGHDDRAERPRGLPDRVLQQLCSGPSGTTWTVVRWISVYVMTERCAAPLNVISHLYE